MTVAQAEQAVAGYIRRQRDAQRLAAWQVMHELNIWLPKGKKIEHPGILLGEAGPKKLLPDGRRLQRLWMSDPDMR